MAFHESRSLRSNVRYYFFVIVQWIKYVGILYYHVGKGYRQASIAWLRRQGNRFGKPTKRDVSTYRL